MDFMENSVKNVECYELHLENRLNYLYASVKTSENLECIKSYWKNLSSECRNRNSDKILIEVKCNESVSDEFSAKECRPNPITVSKMYELGEYIAQLDFFGVKIAFVAKYNGKQELDNFGELVATNRGLNGKLFYDTKAAESWLI